LAARVSFNVFSEAQRSLPTRSGRERAKKPPIITIGYELRPLDGVVALLRR
jgi:hypothetical protein